LARRKRISRGANHLGARGGKLERGHRSSIRCRRIPRLRLRPIRARRTGDPTL